MNNKIHAKWAHFYKHEITAIVTKTPNHFIIHMMTESTDGNLLKQQMVVSRGDLDIHVR